MRLEDQVRVVRRGESDALDAFLEWVGSRGLSLYDAQEEAILELFEGHHVVLDTPTGSGKSMVALALCFREHVAGRRCYYTAPIKALVGEKYRDLAEQFGSEAVGMMTGDGAVNPTGSILCCTAEVLSQLAVRHGDRLEVGAVVMDEFHFYGDRDRGMAWQLPLLLLPQARFLLMSATLGDTRAIRKDLFERTDVEPVVVESRDRPVPLEFEYSSKPLDTTLRDLIGQAKAPIYTVHFSQRSAAEHAQAMLSSDYASAERKEELKQAVGRFRFDSPFGKTLRRMVLHGVGLHHAGLLPKYRMLVERLAQQGLFHVICGTDTLGVGINVPIRTVVFTQLCKFDGVEVDILTARHFQQIAGRAGRKGYDDAGTVVAQAPEWVIENEKLERQIESGRKKRNKVVKKKPPTRGYKHWDETMFEQLTNARPEALRSVFEVDHGLVLLLLQKADENLSDGMAELHALIDASHSSTREKQRLHDDAEARLDQLLRGGVVEDLGEDSVPRYRVHTELQDDFSLHHSLSLYLLFVLEQLDPEHPEHALQVVTQVESILENPGPVIASQVRRERGRVIAELKAQGMPYEERMEVLEEVGPPRPMAEWIYETFNEYKESRPWLADAPIRPKSVIREMYAVQASFSNYVKDLKMDRAEGVLLRYLSQVYKALLQNVPEMVRTPELDDVIGYLRAMLARVDDSLVTDWEALSSDAVADDTPSRPVWMEPRALRARIRAELVGFVRALASGDLEDASSCLHEDTPDVLGGPEALQRAIEPFVEEYGGIATDPRIRQGWVARFEEAPERWVVEQTLLEPLPELETGVGAEAWMRQAEGDLEEAGTRTLGATPWSIRVLVDLSSDAEPSGPLLQLISIEG